MLVDASLIALLLVAGQLLRARVGWLQKGLVPSSMIAGFLGLVGGPQGLGWLDFSPQVDGPPDAIAISRWPAVLVVAVFGTLLLGHRKGHGPLASRLRRVGPVISYNFAAEAGQFAVALLFGSVILRVLAPEVPKQLAVMMPAGYAGGAATSTVFAQGFEAQGWQDALAVGFAFATVGQSVAIVGGVLLINLAARRGWTSAQREAPGEASCLAPSSESFVDEASQRPVGYATVNPLALDPLAWHLGLLGATYWLTFTVDALIHQAVPGQYVIPQFSLAMLLGAMLQGGFEVVGIGKYVDAQTMRRLGSAAADILIVCSIASIRLSVLKELAAPIAILAILGTVYSLAAFAVGRWVFQEFWLERSLFTFGWLTGVVGTSVALVRVIDPRHDSNAVEDYGTSFLILGPLEMILYPIVIWACGAHWMTTAGLGLALISLCFFIFARLPHGDGLRTARLPLAADPVLDASLIP